jgi:hypothetical protein
LDTEIEKKKNKGLTPKEQRELEEEVRKYIGRGFSDVEIMTRLDMQPHVLQTYKKRIYDLDKSTFDGLDKYSIYSDYVLKCKYLVKELDEIKVKFKGRGQWTALVQAIKEKKAVYDSVIKLGQEFGFIEARQNSVKVDAEFSFSTYSDEDLKAEIEKEMKKLNKIQDANNIIPMRKELLSVVDDSNELLPGYQVKNQTKKVKKKSKIKMTLKRKG